MRFIEHSMRRVIHGTFHGAFHAAKDSLLRSAEYSRERNFLQGISGAVAFILFYYIWVLYGEKYENLGLRILGAAACLVYAAREYWPRPMQKFFPAYFVFTTTLSFPFFFTFMALKNELSPVWLLSLFSAIFVLMRLTRGIGAVLIMLAGGSAAVVAYGLDQGGLLLLRAENMKYLFIMVFAVFFGSIFSYAEEMARVEKSREMIHRFLSHEMKTFLAGQGILAAGIRAGMRPLLRTYHRAREAGIECEGESGLAVLDASLEMLEKAGSNALTMAEILYYNSRRGESIDRSSFREFSMRECVERSLAQFPYRSPADRERVRLHGRGDFAVFGSDILVLHVLFNLIQNALRALRESGDGDIRVRILPGVRMNRVLVRDTGAGIAPDILPLVFNWEFTTRSDGSGLGLAFSRKVMRGMGGEITCESVPSSFTEFSLVFPPVEPRATWPA